MTLEQLTAPFESRWAYMYASDGNTVVCRSVKVQKVCGVLYRGKTEDNSSWTECSLYCFLPDVKNGIKLTSRIIDVDQELMPDGMPQNIDVCSTKDEWLSSLDFHMENRYFIAGSTVEFVRQFAPEKAESYDSYRADWYKIRTEDDKHLRAQLRAEKEAEKARKQSELDDAKAKYLGWADTITPLRFGKVRVKLEGFIRSDGKVIRLRDFIVSMVKDGWEPIKVEGVTSWYGSKWEPKESKPRTEYHLSRDGYVYNYKISKTEYDFAVYLTEHKEVLNKG